MPPKDKTVVETRLIDAKWLEVKTNPQFRRCPHDHSVFCTDWREMCPNCARQKAHAAALGHAVKEGW